MLACRICTGVKRSVDEIGNRRRRKATGVAGIDACRKTGRNFREMVQSAYKQLAIDAKYAMQTWVSACKNAILANVA